MTFLSWVKVKILGTPPQNTVLIEMIDEEKLKLEIAKEDLAKEVGAVKNQSQRGATIFGIIDEALHAFDKNQKR